MFIYVSIVEYPLGRSFGPAVLALLCHVAAELFSFSDLSIIVGVNFKEGGGGDARSASEICF